MKMYRTISLLLCVLLTMSLLAGCGKKPVDTGSEPTVTGSNSSASDSTTEPSAEPTTEPATESNHYVDVFFQEPAGFWLNGDTGIFYGPDFPTETSYLSMSTSEADTSFLNMTPFLYETALKLQLAAGSADAETDAEVESITPTQVDGCTAVKIDGSMSVDEVTYRLTQYVVMTEDQNYIFSFADATENGAWQEAFAASAASIDLLREGETAKADFSKLTPYSFDCGVKMYCQKDMEQENSEDSDACLYADLFSFFAIVDQKSDLVDAGFSADMTLEEYAAAAAEAYSLPEMTKDQLGNLYCTQTEESDGEKLFYYFTVKEGTGAFTVCYFCCFEEVSPLLQRSFSLWSSSITLD